VKSKECGERRAWSEAGQGSRRGLRERLREGMGGGRMQTDMQPQKLPAFDSASQVSRSLSPDCRPLLGDCRLCRRQLLLAGRARRRSCRRGRCRLCVHALPALQATGAGAPCSALSGS
jgi:hypothetical protein